jgi:hypothetical protein
MDEKFQDRIDKYLLNRMDDAEKTEFLREIEQDEEKKEQLEFTQDVKDSIRSREEKLQALAQFQRQYEQERRISAYRATGTERAACYCPAPEVAATKPVRSKKKIWLWISGVAAVLVIGFFAIKPMFDYESSPNYNGAPMEQMRGGDEVFSPAPADSTDNDTINIISRRK